MQNASEETIRKIMELNTTLGNKCDFLVKTKKNVLEKMRASNSLKIRQMSKLVEQDLDKITRNEGIIGVDGSINTYGSTYPNYISVMQALAKSTNSKEKVFLADIHTPLLEDNKIFSIEKASLQDIDEKQKAAKLAMLELKAAFMSMKNIDTSLIMMDGSLIRYKIYCGGFWDEFVEEALRKNIYVIGVIEEIKTKDLAGILGINAPDGSDIYDREILFGVLDKGQMIKLNESKENRGLRKCFLRTSNDPHVIGMDALDQQADIIDELADLVYTLTPENSRGIPLWLDIVDSEVKISNKLMDSLVDSYIDKDKVRMLFDAKRDNRTLY